MVIVVLASKVIMAAYTTIAVLAGVLLMESLIPDYQEMLAMVMVDTVMVDMVMAAMVT